MADELHNGDATQPLIQDESHLDMLDQLGMVYTAHPTIKKPYRVVEASNRITALNETVGSASYFLDI